MGTEQFLEVVYIAVNIRSDFIFYTIFAIRYQRNPKNIAVLKLFNLSQDVICIDFGLSIMRNRSKQSSPIRITINGKILGYVTRQQQYSGVWLGSLAVNPDQEIKTRIEQEKDYLIRMRKSATKAEDQITIILYLVPIYLWFRKQKFLDIT